MIANSFIIFLLLILVPDIYLWYRYMRKKAYWMQGLWFVVTIAFVVATVLFAQEEDFVPTDMTWLNVYLLLMGLVTAPKIVFSLCSLFGEKGRKTSLVLIPLLWLAVLYGSFIGNRCLEVKHVELAFSDLPEAFDGYRIVHSSDLHVGTTPESLIREVVDSINGQKADLIAFTGDLKNKLPDEVIPYKELLATLKAKDGVYTVMGNHDYSMYFAGSADEKYYQERRIREQEYDMKWRMLDNFHEAITRDSSSITVSGMENDGEGRFPQLGDINKALRGLDRQSFVVMLEHDPSAWRRKILPECHAQLTLSGHTHGMQFEIFGWCPLSILNRDCDGLYRVGERCLYVTKGVGGVVPFRLGCAPEIVVITLRKK